MLVWIIPSKTYWTAQSCSVLSASFALFLLIKNLWNDFVLWYFVILWSWIIKFYRQILKVLRSPWKMNTFLEHTLQFEWHFLTPKGLSFHLNSEVTAWPESNIFYWRRFLGKFVLTNVYVCTCISSKRDNSSILVISAF